MRKLSIFLFLLFIIGLSACQETAFYQKSFPIQDEVWSYADSLDFSFVIEDTETVYNLELSITHSKAYAFQNLYTKISTYFPSGEKVEDIVSLELAQKNGAWFGDCGKEYCILNIPIQQNIRFKEAGAYKLIIQQNMRKEHLPGIKKIGFAIFEAKSTKN